jgi:type IV secretory pathway VirB9-like protein
MFPQVRTNFFEEQCMKTRVWLPVVLGVQLLGASDRGTGKPVSAPVRSRMESMDGASAQTPAAAVTPVQAPIGSMFGDIMRVPYQTSKVYRLRLFPGSPTIIELPYGESVDNIWIDSQWWGAESTPDSNRVVVRALAADGILGRKTLFHLETKPNGLRVSFALEAVSDFERQPGVFQLYLAGEDAGLMAKRAVDAKVAQRVAELRTVSDVQARQDLDNWRAEAASKFRNAYSKSGSLEITKIIDDGVQTFIYSPERELSNLSFKNQDGKEEVLNYELHNGAYIVNRVLQKNEAFVLNLGKKKTTIRLN